MRSELPVKSNGLHIWTESFGNHLHAPILLIAGAGAQSIFWEDEFCQRLAESERFVVRFDNRDTGLSDSVDFESSPYTINDMAADAIAILDAYGLPAAHMVGASGGGLICQVLALEHRTRVLTISALISSPLGTGSNELPNSGYGDLPPPTTEFLEQLQDFVGEVPEDRDAFIDWTLRKYEAISGSLEVFDKKAKAERAELEFARARNLQAMNNHALAVNISPVSGRALLGGLDVPTLVVHGTEDPLLPYAHGRAIAETIPGAELLTIEKMGHDLPRPAWSQIIKAILQHTTA
tara:strand:- start:294 stop:1172 length:879 start_codon:yes stop_codon:yes gene_type:complete